MYSRWHHWSGIDSYDNLGIAKLPTGNIVFEVNLISLCFEKIRWGKVCSFSLFMRSSRQSLVSSINRTLWSGSNHFCRLEPLTEDEAVNQGRLRRSFLTDPLRARRPSTAGQRERFDRTRHSSGEERRDDSSPRWLDTHFEIFFSNRKRWRDEVATLVSWRTSCLSCFDEIGY